jgi:SAM-dependent methyltransferase
MSDKNKTAQTFDEYEARYSETVNRAVAFTGLSVDFFTRVKAGYLLDACVRHFGRLDDRDILDVGCGVGNFHSLLSPHFCTLTGVDISSLSIETAAARHPEVRYDSYDGSVLPYEDARFDIVFTVCVMHHVPPAQWRQFANEMGRVLKPGGIALVFEHNPRNPLTMRTVNNCPFDADAVLLHGPQTAALLADAGLEVRPPCYILSLPAANRALRRIDALFSHLPFGAQYYVEAVRV